MFGVYLRLGFEHLLDLQGYDHILFLAVLCAAYPLARWRELLILVTAFTVGHSVSLALATIGLVRVDSGLIEFLIPVTIFATAVINLAMPAGRAEPAAEPVHQASRARRATYGAALLFGVIHGLGFSNFLRLMLGEGSIFVPLLSFNVGLELAQIAVALLVVAVGWAVTQRALAYGTWTRLVSVGVGVVALTMAWQRWPW